MGRQQYSQVGTGFTEAEAKQNANQEALEEYGHEQGYSGAMNSATTCRSKCLKKPKLAKTCKVEKTVQKGARKWETVFIIEPRWESRGGGSDLLRNSTQGKALIRAKELALRNQTEYRVRMEKQLSQGSGDIAIVTPKKSERGKWEFSGEARC